MFSSVILDVIIGLVSVFLAASLLASALTEAFSTVIGLRASTLLDGIKQLLNDPNLNALAGAVYRNGLANPLSDGQPAQGGQPSARPSYIDPVHFATALIDGVQAAAGQAATLNEAIDQVADPQIRATLAALYRRTAGNVDQFHAAVARWFDTAMDRVGGTYKRRTKAITFCAGMLAAFALNADPIYIGETLWQRPVAAADLAKLPLLPPPCPSPQSAAAATPQPTAAASDQAAACSNAPPAQLAAQMMQQIDAVAPLLGWNGFTGTGPRGHGIGLFLMIVGWLVTAGTTLFGAPFWFDVLQRFVNLRGTGTPADPAPAPAPAQGA